MAYNARMTISLLNFIWLLVGLLVGVAVNWLADYLPDRERPSWITWGWRQRKRPSLVLAGTAVLFFCLPFWITELVNLVINSLYIAILILILVTDLEHQLIYNVVVYPAILLAIGGSFLVTPDENTIQLALVGGLVGLLVFGALYGLANLLYGRERVPLGMGDVKLALLLGLMLGFHRIWFCLFWAIMLGGVITLLLLATRRVGRGTALPYGQYLALSGIAFLIWGADYAQQFIN
ncbi:MAG: prepilin peptidase [Anaerolineae bacterium]|nr:prepilin peptidase [Anaerolineae bacterium]